MSSPRLALRRAPDVLIHGLTAATVVPARSCLHISRRFSQTQSWAMPEKHHDPLPFQSYPLPSKLPSSARSESMIETPIASPIPIIQETRPPTQPITEPITQPKVTTAPPEVALKQEAQTPKPAPPRRKLKPRKAAMKLTPTAVEHLRQLLNQPDPKMIRVGVRNRGCSGLAYHLEYVDKPAPFDDEVEQDGVKVIIDSKALFSIIGSEMDWVEDKLNQRFVFRNPNIKEECGCGESFMV
ncbi:hypothetical protein F4777DRAFT_434798 [Nemania sp. FL0916]|nr:hypothetical protein F4777DRAFT_434798 [Nemania sp. FL0916]